MWLTQLPALMSMCHDLRKEERAGQTLSSSDDGSAGCTPGPVTTWMCYPMRVSSRICCTWLQEPAPYCRTKLSQTLIPSPATSPHCLVADPPRRARHKGLFPRLTLLYDSCLCPKLTLSGAMQACLKVMPEVAAKQMNAGQQRQHPYVLYQV